MLTGFRQGPVESFYDSYNNSVGSIINKNLVRLIKDVILSTLDMPAIRFMILLIICVNNRSVSEICKYQE
jgi:hypothetical protein